MIDRLALGFSRRKVARLRQSRDCPEEVDLDLEGLGWRSRVELAF